MTSMTPGATPDINPLPIRESPFSSKSLIITVGANKVPFSVHEAKLAQTSFFNAHSPLTILEKNSLQKTNQPDERHDTSHSRTIKSEDGSLGCVRLVTPDYHVEDRFFLFPAAFDIFVKYLYNEPPLRPGSRQQVKTLLRAYRIALNYNCYVLQNKIIDCFRAYYSRTNISLDDLVWTSNRFGDSVDCSLNAYFVEQIAYEIADRGLDDFANSNSSTRPFLEQGNKAIRSSLFAALVRRAQNPSIGDPAVQGRKFHVHETGEHAGELRP